MYRIELVAHRAFAKELRLAEIRIPAGAADPTSHHVAPARHPVDVVCGRAGDQGENLISQGLGAALIGVKAEDPIAFADFDRTVAQIAEAIERHLDHTRAERGGDLSGAIDAKRIHYHHLVGP